MSEEKCQYHELLHVPLICRTCGNEMDVTLPVEPVYDMRFVADIIPMEIGALRNFLFRRRETFPSRYRFDAERRKHRVLTASEVRAIRAAIVFPGSVKNRKRIYTDTALQHGREGVRAVIPRVGYDKVVPIRGSGGSDTGGTRTAICGIRTPTFPLLSLTKR
jgi:hypothetical protein